jgi:hypothetical protein
MTRPGERPAATSWQDDLLMVHRATLLIAMVIALAGGYFAYRWWSDPTNAVKRRLDGLAATLSVTVRESEVARVVRIAELRGYFAPEVRIRVGRSGPEINSREEVLGIVSAWTPPPGGWEVRFVDVQVTVAPDSTAQASLTVETIGHDARTGQRTLDATEAAVVLALRDGQWVITSGEARETLQKMSK